MPTSHIVLVSWRPGEAEHAERTVRPAVRGFSRSVPGVLGVVEGPSSSPEGLEDGHDYGFVVTFESAEARDVYLDHPSHRPVADAIRAASRHVVVFDV